MAEKAILALEDGKVFRGYRFGASTDAGGEVVFTTGMTGYQEDCTDPSFRAHIVVMTYPLIGNYGVNSTDDESRQPWLAGMVVREYTEDYSNWRATDSLHNYLERAGVSGIHGVDTRALTRHIRSQGALRGVIVSASEYSEAEAVEKAKSVKSPSQLDVIGQVSSARPYSFTGQRETAAGTRLAVIDCGVKESILESLADRGPEVLVVPHDAKIEDILALEPDGLLTSPGPGDPQNAGQTIETIREVVSSGIPYFGICLGHQLLALSLGAATRKLKFGHRGGNHPVMDLATGKVYITSQNHGYEVDADSLKDLGGWFVTHRNINDQSVEGIAHPDIPAFSVQYHPEGAPGPLDSEYLFDKFLGLVDTVRVKSGGRRTRRLDKARIPMPARYVDLETQTGKGGNQQNG